MKPMRKLIDWICILLCATGLLIGLTFAAALILADGEAAFYFFDPTNLTPGFIKTLRCPTLITTSEYGQISVSFTNRLDRIIEPFARLNLANAEGPSRTDFTQEAIAPGESITYSWKVSHNDAYRNNILVQVIQTPLYPKPAAQATCGIWIVNLPAIYWQPDYSFYGSSQLVIGNWFSPRLHHCPSSIDSKNQTNNRYHWHYSCISRCDFGYRLSWHLVSRINLLSYLNLDYFNQGFVQT